MGDVGKVGRTDLSMSELSGELDTLPIGLQSSSVTITLRIGEYLGVSLLEFDFEDDSKIATMSPTAFVDLGDITTISSYSSSSYMVPMSPPTAGVGEDTGIKSSPSDSNRYI